MSNVPIFLCEGRNTAAIERLLALIKRNHFVPITLRELFWFLRGVKRISGNACVVLLTTKDETSLEHTFSCLQSADMQLVLAINEPLSAKMCERLLTMPNLTVIPVSKKGTCDGSSIVFCPSVDEGLLRDFRKHGVRMVITKDRTLGGEIPSGMDVLCAIDLFSFDRVANFPDTFADHGDSILLPLDENPLLSAMHLAIPLSIIGTDQTALYNTLSCDAWQACYTPVEDRYDVSAAFSALRVTPCETIQNVRESFCGYLARGCYIELRTDLHFAEINGSDRILIYGYDDRVKVFAARVAMQRGSFDRVDIRLHTIESICASSGTTTRLLSICTNNAVYPTESFVRELLEQPDPCDGKFYAREAATRYANRFYKRFSEGDQALSADSLRMFLEERRRFGFAFWYLAKREDFYLEPYEDYLHMLANVCQPAIDDLRGKTMLKSDMPLFLTSELMRKLLYTEESCASAFLDDWERLKYRKAFLDQTTQKEDHL